jgi:catalase
VERKHIADALTFELSKCDRSDIRSRMVSHLLNIHADLAAQVADALGMAPPQAAKAARPTREDLPPSDPLSIVKRGPKRFEGRKLGILVTDGADAALLDALLSAAKAEQAVVEIVAPKIGGVTLSDGARIPADQKLDGGPSVLYDAVALLPSTDQVAVLSEQPPARDFVSDAFVHCKFIGYVGAAEPLLQKAGAKPDEATIKLAAPGDAAAFLKACGQLRLWERELAIPKP